MTHDDVIAFLRTRQMAMNMDEYIETLVQLTLHAEAKLLEAHNLLKENENDVLS